MATLSRAEKKILKDGLYVAVPINSLILFTAAENEVLTVIRHCTNMGQRAISVNLFCVLTGRSDKSVREAIKSLEELGVITCAIVCKAGSIYRINWSVLGPVWDKLNKQRNPVERMKIADAFRGPKAMHTKLIEQYSKTMFNK